METNKETIEQVLDRFIEVNQSVFTELEETGATIESVEVILIPVERRLLVRMREYKNNGLQTHQLDKSLVMKNVDFDASLKRQLSPSAVLRGTNMRNLDPATLEKVLADVEGKQQIGE